MRRDIREARDMLDAVRGRLPLQLAQRYDAILTDAEADATTKVKDFAADREHDATERIESAIIELRDVRDEFKRITSEADAGTGAAASLAESLGDLQARQRRAWRVLESADAAIGTIERVSADRLRWHAEFERRFPHLMRDYPW